PALFTRMSSLPYAASVASISRAHSSSLVTSICTKRASPPDLRMSAATLSPMSARISATTTLAPSLANSRASASPMPCPPPVTIATLSLRRISFLPCVGRMLIRLWRVRHPTCRLDKAGNIRDTDAGADIGEHEWPRAAHSARVSIHHLETGSDEGRKVDLVDDQEVAARDPRATLARDLVARRDVDHVDGQVRQFRAERRREVVAAALDQDEVERGKSCAQLRHARQIDAGILADRGVRAAAGLDAHDALRRQRTGAGQELGVLLGIDIVGNGRDFVAAAQMPAQRIHQRGLAGAHGSADADAQRAVRRACHERNSLVYWVSWRSEAMSARKAQPPMSSRVAARVSAATRRTAGSSAASTATPTLCPSGTSRTAAEIRLDVKACRYATVASSSAIACEPASAPT